MKQLSHGLKKIQNSIAYIKMKMLKHSIVALLFVCSISAAWANEPTSKPELVKTITKHATTAQEKAQAIFSWIATHISYDTSYKITDADNALKYRKGVCAAYSALFNEFCTLAGLKSIRISGYAKSIYYDFDGVLTTPNHDWNAVQIDGTWALVDATWGAGYVNNGVFTKDFSTAWFDVDPAILIFTHFPEDRQWQQLEQSIPIDAFWALPTINPEVAGMGFDGKTLLDFFLQHPNTAFPFTYSFKGTFKVNKMPLTRTLSAQTSYDFEFELPEGTKVALVSNGNFITDFTREGNTCSKSLIPPAGQLTVMFSYNNSNQFAGVFGYKVE
jgi:hypothetical protein